MLWKGVENLRIRCGSRCGIGLDDGAEAPEKDERGIDLVVFALFFLVGGFRLLDAAPEGHSIMGIENEKADLEDRGGRKRSAVAGRRRAATSATGADTDSTVGGGSVDGDDEIGSGGVADEGVVSPSLEGVADDVIGDASAGVFDVDGAGGHEAGVRGEERRWLWGLLRGCGGEQERGGGEDKRA
jgi:hypothetical protein